MWGKERKEVEQRSPEAFRLEWWLVGGWCQKTGILSLAGLFSLVGGFGEVMEELGRRRRTEKKRTEKRTEEENRRRRKRKKMTW